MNLQLLGGEEAVVVVDFSQTLSPSYFLFKHQVFCKTLDLVLTLVIVHNFTCFYEELPCSSVSSSSGRKRQILLSTRQKGRRWPSALRWWWTGDCRRSWGPRYRTGQDWLGCSPPDPDSTGSWQAPLGSGRGNVSRPVGSVGGVLSPEGVEIIEKNPPLPDPLPQWAWVQAASVQAEGSQEARWTDLLATSRSQLTFACDDHRSQGCLFNSNV